MIEVRNLSKRYGDVVAVDGLGLDVAPGEILGLVGPNGAGKTSTLRCMTGIIPPSAGTVRIAGHDLASEPIEAKRALAFVPDEPRLFDYLTARDHLTITARLYGVEDGTERGDRLLHELELGDRRDAFPSELSRGMKQKLMVAMALLHRPRALLLDEPLTGLDPAAMRRMKDRIRDAATDGVAVVLSSHMLHLVEELCGRIVIIVGGTKRFDGTVEEIRTAFPDLGADAGLEAIFMRAIEPRARRVTGTLLLLQWMTLRGRVVRSLRLLRQPKYAIGTAVGALWLFVWLVRPLLSVDMDRVQVVGLDSFTGDLLPALGLVAAVVVTVALASPWLVPFGRLGLKFREAELTMLLQAPLSRRRLIGYGLLKSAPGVLVTALVLGLLLGSGGLEARLRGFLGLWLLFVLWDLNSKWRAQFLLRQREIAPSSARLRRLALSVALLALFVALGVATVDHGSRVAAAMRGVDAVNAPAALVAVEPGATLRLLTWPGAVLTAPALAADWGAFVRGALPLLLLIVVQRELVLRSPARFEESALEHARSEETKRSPTRRYTRASARSRRLAAFALAPSGAPELAVLWKNVMRVSRIPFWQVALGAIVSLVAMAVVPVALGVSAVFHNVVMVAALPISLFAVLTGGMVWHNDLRAELAHLELARTWPVRAHRFVLAQVASPALLGFLASTVAVGFALAAWSGLKLRSATGDGAVVTVVPLTDRLLGVAPGVAVALLAIGVLPALAGAAFMSSAFQNLAVMMAPAWMGRGDAPRGIAAFGQRLVFSTALFIALALGLLPSAALVGAAMLAQHLAGLGWTAWALPVWGTLAALPPVGIGLAAVALTARMWRDLDSSAEILEIGG